MGAMERGIIEASYRRGVPLPAKIRDAPELLPGLELFYVAFLDLSTCRQIGLTSGPIPWTAIELYADRKEFNDELREDLHTLIRAMDTVYIQHWERKRGNPEGSQPQHRSDSSQG